MHLTAWQKSDECAAIQCLFVAFGQKQATAHGLTAETVKRWNTPRTIPPSTTDYDAQSAVGENSFSGWQDCRGACVVASPNRVPRIRAPPQRISWPFLLIRLSKSDTLSAPIFLNENNSG